MRNPCQICERALLDKDKCSLDCERRHEYCRYMGIGTRGEIGPIVERGLAVAAKSCSSVRVEQTPYKRQVVGSSPTRTTTNPSKIPKPVKIPRVPKPPKPPFDWHAPRGMRSKGGRLEASAELIRQGRSVRDIYKLTGMSKGTVAKLRKVLEEQNGGPFLCGCGEPAVHHGNCSYRRERQG